MLQWARDEGLLLSPEGAAAVSAYERLLADGVLQAADVAVAVNPEAGLKSAERMARAMKLRRPVRLPTSAKVGGIITPV
jgi:threonine synthase